MQDKPIIWLYWENLPAKATPTYINLCYQTIFNNCQKDFQIICLGPEDISYYLPNINKNYLLLSQIAHKADYIRYNLLYQYGGIWLDSDTIVLKSLIEIISYIKRFGFVFTGYRNENNLEFPLIAFLGAEKNNIVLKKVITEIDEILRQIEKNGVQPEWDEIGGTLLQRCIIGEQHYMYDLEYFSPAKIHHTSDLRCLFFDLKPGKKYGKAYTQFLPNSVIGEFLHVMEEDILLTHTLLARIFKQGLGQRNSITIRAKQRILNKIKQYPFLYQNIKMLYLRVVKE